MTWKALKDRVEALGAIDDMQINFIDIKGSHTGIELTYYKEHGLCVMSCMADGDAVLEPE